MPKEDDINPAEAARRAALLAGAPFALFVFTVVIVGLFYDDWPFWVFITFLLTVMKSLLVARYYSAQRWKRRLGPMLAFAACAGMMLGLHSYYTDLVYYSYYRNAERHVNVVASVDPLRFEDSGLLGFSLDTRVDMMRSVGYQSAVKNQRLCVAPVVDSSFGPDDPVSFFAVGVGCCDWRAQFSCGSASDGEAHDAALYLSLSDLVSPAAAWIFEDHVLREGLRAALDLDQASFNMTLARHTRFLHWSKVPSAVQDRHLEDARLNLSLWSVLFFLAFLGAARLIVL